MTHKDLIEHYGLDEQLLHSLYNKVVQFLTDKGIIVTLTSLENVVESKIYKLENITAPDNQHHESCLSDGKEIFLHDNLEEIGGICSRLYDILHMGCGHLWQWSADKSSGLKFHSSYAWDIGTTYYTGASEEELNTVWNYEEEAGALALANLNMILKNHAFDERFSRAVLHFFNDYMQTDLNYITTFYRTNEVKNFFEGWLYNTTPIRMVSTDFKLRISRHTNKCIALINLR